MVMGKWKCSGDKDSRYKFDDMMEQPTGLNPFLKAQPVHLPWPTWTAMAAPRSESFHTIGSRTLARCIYGTLALAWLLAGLRPSTGETTLRCAMSRPFLLTWMETV